MAEILERSKAAGFLGPGPVADHLARTEAFLAAAPPPSRFLDLGSGGGVPGLVLAVRWASSVGTLLDAQLRRIRFLVQALEALGVADRVTAVHGRAEELARDPEHRGRYDVATARSFGSPGVTAECGAGFLRAGGVLVVAEPPGAPAARWPAAGLERLGLADDGLATGGGATTRRLRSPVGPPDDVPRRAAALRRHPRF